MRKLIILKDGHIKWEPDFLSQVVDAVLTSNFVR